MSHERRMTACMFTVGVTCLMWILEIRIRSRKMFTRNLVELMIRGTSGRSKALVAIETEYSMAEDRARKEDIRTYFKDASRTAAGTNKPAKVGDAARKTKESKVPKII